jgi:hypothetical protein
MANSIASKVEFIRNLFEIWAPGSVKLRSIGEKHTPLNPEHRSSFRVAEASGFLLPCGSATTIAFS